MRQGPFVDLHQHCLLSAPRETLATRGITLPVARIRHQHDITSYAKMYINPLLEDHGKIRDLIIANFDSCIRENVVHVATSVDYTLARRFPSVDDCAAFLHAQRASVAGQLAVEYDLGISRDNYATNDEAAIVTLLNTGLFAGIDLYGNELLANERQYVSIYEHAGALGLLRKAHIGEYRSAADIIELMEILRLDEVQHGLSVVDDVAIAREAAARNVVFNVCPTSNVTLKQIDYRAHPIGAMLEHGINVTIGTDDKLLFGQSVQQEYAHLATSGALTQHQLVSVHAFSLDYKGIRTSAVANTQLSLPAP